MERNLDIGQTFSRIFEIYGSQFTLLVPAALLVFIPVAVIGALIGGGILGFVVAIVLGLLAGYLYQAMVVEAARDMMDGRRDHSIGSLFSAAAPVVLPLVGAGLLAGIGIAIGLFLLVIPGLFLLTIWAVIAPVIVVERKGAIESLGRSREVVKGNGWAVFGVIVILFLLQLVLGFVVGLIIGGSDASAAVRLVVDLVVRVLVAPLSALAAAVIYFELAGTGKAQAEPAAGPGGLT